MKILHIDYDDYKNPYASGGQAYMTYELMSRLSKKHSITVVTGNYPKAENKTIKNVNYVRLGFGNLGYIVSILSHWFLAPFYVLIYQWKYDLILECFTAPFTVSFIPFVCVKPLVALPLFWGSDNLSTKYKIPFHIFVNLLIKKYKHFITLTKSLAKKIKKLNPNASYEVIPGGVSKELLLSKAIDNNYVLYLGRIDIYNKGLDLLVEAWKDIDYKLVIAGNGKINEINSLREKINLLNLNSKITFVGKVEGNKKLELLRKSTFVIQPSKFETFGFVALEALASGKIVVCFDIEGFKWIPENYAIKARGINSKSLLKAIQKALDSEDIRKKAVKENKKFASKFDWITISKKFNYQLEKIALI